MEQVRQQMEQRLIEKAWADEKFRAELIANPKAMLEKQLGYALPEHIQIIVLEETADTLYLRLPVNPDSLTDEALDNVTGGVPQHMA